MPDSHRWPEIASNHPSSEREERRRIWPDGCKVWFTGEAECVWIEADWPRICVVAERLRTTSPVEDLILRNEGYNDVIELRGTSKPQVRALRREGCD
jgi:hypothetical protein